MSEIATFDSLKQFYVEEEATINLNSFRAAIPAIEDEATSYSRKKKLRFFTRLIDELYSGTSERPDSLRSARVEELDMSAVIVPDSEMERFLSRITSSIRFCEALRSYDEAVAHQREIHVSTTAHTISLLPGSVQRMKKVLGYVGLEEESTMTDVDSLEDTFVCAGCAPTKDKYGRRISGVLPKSRDLSFAELVCTFLS